MAFQVQVASENFTKAATRGRQAEPNPFTDAIPMLIDDKGKIRNGQDGKPMTVKFDVKDHGNYVTDLTSRAQRAKLVSRIRKAADGHGFDATVKVYAERRGTKDVIVAEFTLKPAAAKGK